VLKGTGWDGSSGGGWMAAVPVVGGGVSSGGWNGD